MKKQKLSKKHLEAYIKMLGDSGRGLVPSMVDIDENLNLIKSGSGNILIEYSVLNKPDKLTVLEMFGQVPDGENVPESLKEPSFVPGHSEPVDISNENEFTKISHPQPEPESEFEEVSNRPIIVDFWEPVEGEQKVCLFLGEGRTFETKYGQQKTWLFAELVNYKSGNETSKCFLISQKAGLSDFKSETPLNGKVYIITYKGLVEPKEGNAFHAFNIARSKTIHPVKYHFPIQLMTCDFHAL